MGRVPSPRVGPQCLLVPSSQLMSDVLLLWVPGAAPPHNHPPVCMPTVQQRIYNTAHKQMHMETTTVSLLLQRRGHQHPLISTNSSTRVLTFQRE